MRYPHSLIALFCLFGGLLTGCNSTSANSPSTSESVAPAATTGTTAPAAPVAVATPVVASPQPVAAIPAPVPATLPPVTILLAGDSTVCNYPSTTVQEGWGMELAQFFNDQVTVNNQAVGGANVQSFKRGGNWTRIMAAVKPGDYVLMQFGANDSGTAHGPVYPPEYIATLSQMADEIHAKGATPLFVTPSAFFDWTPDGKENNARLAPYAAACYSAGDAGNALVVDLNARGVEWLNSIGKAAAAPFYLPNSQHVPDKAHFVKAGAVQMAQMVAQEIRRINSPLAAYLKPASNLRALGNAFPLGSSDAGPMASLRIEKLAKVFRFIAGPPEGLDLTNKYKNMGRRDPAPTVIWPPIAYYITDNYSLNYPTGGDRGLHPGSISYAVSDAATGKIVSEVTIMDDGTGAYRFSGTATDIATGDDLLISTLERLAALEQVEKGAYEPRYLTIAPPYGTNIRFRAIWLHSSSENADLVYAWGSNLESGEMPYGLEAGKLYKLDDFLNAVRTNPARPPQPSLPGR